MRKEKIKQGLLEIKKATLAKDISKADIEAVLDRFDKTLKDLRDDRIERFFDLACDHFEWFPKAAQLKSFLLYGKGLECKRRYDEN